MDWEMRKEISLAPNDFCWATGIEDTFIPQTMPGLRALDEYELTQHYTMWKQDLALAVQAGSRALRWGIPWYKVQPARGEWDWRWTDEVLDYMVNVQGLTPILDVMHYGTPLWLDASFADPDYPHLVAEYVQAVAARYKSLVRYYTPLNEPTVNAMMSGRGGQWPPYLRGDQGYLGVLKALARGIALSTQALKAEQPDMLTVQVEAMWHHWTKDESLAFAVAQSNAQQFLSLDLTTGRVNPEHLLYPWLLDNGFTEAEMEWFQSNAVSYDFIGGNYYPWGYVQKSRRGKLRMVSVAQPKGKFASGETIAVPLEELYRRYQVPVLVTETSSKGSVERRAAWMDETLRAVRRLRTAGVPVVGYTWFPLFSMVEWEYRPATTPVADHLLHLGLFDAAYDDEGVLQRHATPLVEHFRQHIAQPMPAIGGVPAAEPAAVPVPEKHPQLERRPGTGPLAPALGF
jgi:beta-glucosidase/6-phospho-beta-glucosidase/beta-galactosidase